MFVEIKSMPGITVNGNSYESGDNMRMSLYGGLSDVIVRKDSIVFTYVGPGAAQFNFSFSDEAMGEYHRIKRIIDEKTLK